MLLTISTGTSRMAKIWSAERMSWEALCTRLANTQHTDETVSEYQSMTPDEKVKAKDVGGFVGGQLRGSDRKNSELLSRSVLALDIDYGTDDLIDDYELMHSWACLIHTTHSHTPQKPRYRMYFPFLRPVTPDEYEPIGRMVAKDIGIDMFDDSTYQPARLMFWPSTCKDGEFICRVFQGDPIDPDLILSRYEDWRDCSSWPVSSRQSERIMVVNGEKQMDPREKPGLVGAFCRAYDIHQAIATFLSDVYEQSDKDPNRYTYKKGSTSQGLVVYDDIFAFSHHGTDPAGDRTCNAYDLVRIHKFGVDDTPEAKAQMAKLAAADSNVKWNLYNPFLISDEDGLLRRASDQTEMGNAIKLKDNNYNCMRYNPSLGWCVWNGMRWVPNSEGEAKRRVMLQCETMLKEAFEGLAKIEDKSSDEYKEAQGQVKWANSSRSLNNIKHTLELAQSLMSVPDIDDFDHDPWELNTPAGIVNLKTGTIGAHATWHMCTMITKVAPGYGDCPLWHDFLKRVTGGDKDLEEYLQEVAGMAVVGKVYEENLVMVVGPGSNGKSTLFDVWLALLGDYGKTVRNEVLVGTKNGGEVAGINQLRGKRMVITGELEESMVMSSATLKKLTSRDYISADIKFKEPITFKPSHTLILHTNHLPRLRSFDDGTLRRIAVCPFNTIIKSAERRTDYADFLVQREGPQILQWMIDGAKKFFQNDKKILRPEAVIKATQEYVDSEDKIKRFLDEECEVKAGVTIQSSRAYEAYAKWLKDNGLRYAGGIKAFRNDLKRLGFDFKRTAKGGQFMGFGLSEDDLGFDEEEEL